MNKGAYLDNAATSFPKAPGVPEVVAQFLRTSAGNPGRGGHRLTVAATRVVERARWAVATLLGGDPERTLLGPGCTYALNTLLFGLLGPGDRVICSALEHNAVMRPLRALEAQRGVCIRVLEGEGPAALPTVAALRRAIAEAPTRLVVLTHASNVSGAVLPIAALTAAAAPVPVVVDAAQSAGSVPLDFAATGAAALCCSGHKGLLGPTGVGVTLLAPGFTPPPLVLGGTGSRSESELMPEALPDLLEAGTPNTAGLAGLAVACAWLADRGVAAVHAHDLALARHAAEGLAALPGVEVIGGPLTEAHTGALSFRVRGVDNGELALWLDREAGLQLRAGLHCAPAAHRRLGTFPDGTLRAAFGPFNTLEHADALVGAVGRYPEEPHPA
ncbi:MAG: aminotransferase class V-fold PLP-dependent enzyme [Pseudomonadota bacterium]